MRFLIPAALVALLVTGCVSEPATVTPVTPSQPVGSSIDLPVNPPPGQSGPVVVPTLSIAGLETYVEPAGLYSLNVPQGWISQTQPLSQGDAKVGTLFSAPQGTGLVTVTQFDNGQTPPAVGSMANQILELTGVTKLPGYLEIGRTNVLERPEEAVQVEIGYTRTSDGLPMHALVLFQIDGTTLSMVNASVESASWSNASPAIHDILSSYRKPAVTIPTP